MRYLDFLWNVFGVAAYVIPFILFGLVSFLISNKDNRNAYVKESDRRDPSDPCRSIVTPYR